MEPLRPALHRLKYRSDIALGEALAWSLAGFLDGLGWQAELVIPIPLSRQRLQERGYNQVGLIAKPLAQMMRWQYSEEALKRARHTRSQVGLTAAQRRTNTLGAFQAQAPRVQGKTILLIDDVATTGATLSAASASLVSAGARRVYALTMAKALPKYGFDRVEQPSFHPPR
jgi:ComF family protein